MKRGIKKTYLLCVLDGFGLNPNPRGNAIAMARKPNFDRMYSTCPATTLVTHGERVGLPDGQMGNSEVGHLNIGAGRVVEQWLLRIGRALKGDYLARSSEYQNFLKKLSPPGRIHVMGLFSDGGVHSHSDHLFALLERLLEDFRSDIVLHVVTDGRDTSPHRAGEQARALEEFAYRHPRIRIGTVSGRFYAMDRDKRWERTKRAYDAVALGEAPAAADLQQAIQTSYRQNVTDEFIEPVVVERQPFGAHDGFIFFNFREDRARQIVQALCVENFSEFTRPAPLPHAVLCFTEYDERFHLPFLFPIVPIKNHLGEVLACSGRSQLRTAETEKYPHVTYFMNGGTEEPYSGETRLLVPSPRDVKTYDLKPEMSAVAVTDGVVEAISAGTYDVIVVNLANCDMVGHTGVIPAAVQAVETVDTCLGRMLAALREHGGEALILADHGNADQMIDYETGAPHTAHTKHPVPCVMVGHAATDQLQPGGALCDVAPTLLKMMGIPQPPEMTGRSLF